jgi:hypothetical protein
MGGLGWGVVVKIVEMIVDNVKARGKIGRLHVRKVQDLPEQDGF